MTRRRRHWTRDPVTLTLTALAAHRITRLLTTDQLPPVERLRRRVEDALPGPWAHGPECAWCVGFWTAVALTAAAECADRSHGSHGSRTYRLAVTPWALASVVGLIADHEVS